MLYKDIIYPIYKFGYHEEMKTNPLGLTKIKTGKGWLLVDNKSLVFDTLGVRRVHMPLTKLCKFSKRINTMRELIKEQSGTKFIDNKGNIFVYKKSSKLNKVISRKIRKKNIAYNLPYMIIFVKGIYLPFMCSHSFYNYNYASIMETEDGPFLYNFTDDSHETYRRKI